MNQYVISLPNDAAPHTTANTEWWYCFAFLDSDKGGKYAIMASFFRVGEIENTKGHYLIFSIIDLKEQSFSPYSIIDTNMLLQVLTIYLPIYFTHHPKDIDTKKLYTELLKLKLPKPHQRMGNVHITNQPTSLVYGDKALIFSDKNEQAFTLKLSAEGDLIDLYFHSLKPMALIGNNGKPDSLYYYSFTRNEIKGYIEKNNQIEYLTGSGWFDHQWGKEYNLLIDSGWNWFGIQLDDGRELLINQFKYVKNQKTYSPMANLISQDGSLKFTRNVVLKPLRYWRSSRTNANYPVKWEINIEEFGIKLIVEAMLEDQEMPSLGPLQAIWEGACYVIMQEKSHNETKSIEGKGFMELVGYANYNAFR